MKHDMEKHRKKILRWVAEDRTIDWMVKALGHGTDKALRRFFRDNNVERNHKTGPRPGARSKLWKGGRRVNEDGYVEIYYPDHPSCIASNQKRKAKKSDRSYNRKRYVLEHRIVMEQYLGRCLRDEEIVHHKNGKKQDNRIANLELYACNADHLRDELTGRCPRWTPAGLRNLRRAADAKAGSVRVKPLSDDQRYKRLTCPTKSELGTSVQNPSQRAVMQKQLAKIRRKLATQKQKTQT